MEKGREKGQGACASDRFGRGVQGKEARSRLLASLSRSHPVSRQPRTREGRCLLRHRTRFLSVGFRRRDIRRPRRRLPPPSRPRPGQSAPDSRFNGFAAAEGIRPGAGSVHGPGPKDAGLPVQSGNTLAVAPDDPAVPVRLSGSGPEPPAHPKVDGGSVLKTPFRARKSSTHAVNIGDCGEEIRDLPINQYDSRYVAFSVRRRTP